MHYIPQCPLLNLLIFFPLSEGEDLLQEKNTKKNRKQSLNTLEGP